MRRWSSRSPPDGSDRWEGRDTRAGRPHSREVAGIISGQGDGRPGGAAAPPAAFYDDRLTVSILENLPGMVFVKEAAGLRFVYFNRAGEELLGLGRESLLGKSDFDLFPLEQAERFTETDRKVLASRRPLDVAEEPIDTAHHGRRWLHTRKIGLFSDSGAPLFLVGISEDITERISADRALEAQRLLLEQSARLSALGELAAGVAHEVNTPLSAISLRAEMLLRMADTGVLEVDRLRREAAAITATVERIARSIGGLRRFGRVGADEPVKRVRVSVLVGEVLELSRARMNTQGIELVVNVPEALEVEGRPVQMGQVLVNLLNNACDAVSQAPVRRIEICAEGDADHVRIAVVDSGPPIPAEVRSRLMEPFFTTKPVGKGTGLGLSLSKSIAEAHGGTLTLDGSSGATRFVVTLPARWPP
jgi:PAS domain S-box-containing protein